MADFLLELLTEEIPARMQAGARNDLGRLFAEHMADAGLETGEIAVLSTPRRLTLAVNKIAAATEATRKEVKGPKASAPATAIDGFLKKTGLSRDELEERDGTLFAIFEQPAKTASEVLSERIPLIVWRFPWPKSMRWGESSKSTASLRWVRPLQGLVAILDGDVLDVSLDMVMLWQGPDNQAALSRETTGIQAGASTLGHRFHHPGPITIGGAKDYLEKMRACHVIVDHDEREDIIREVATKVAADAGLQLIEDEKLVVENAGLTEWPVPLLGRFDSEYLDLPREVIVLTMRTNQRYFACTDETGALAPAFVCVANIDAKDGGDAIVEGNRRVLAARLADARFFWEQDLKADVDELSERLDEIVFFQGLGTYAEKQYRLEFFVDYLRGTLKRDDIKGIWPTSTRAKLDLVTATVGEFPELQGVVGSYLLARNERVGEMAYALRGLYQTAHQITASQADAPTNLLQLADRLDNIVAFASVGVWFKGSGDPYGIRQSAQAAIAALLKSSFRVPAKQLIWLSYKAMLNSFSMSRNLYAVETLTGRGGETREIETPVTGAGLPDQSSQEFEAFRDHSFRALPATIEQLRGNGFVDWAIERIQRYYGDQVPSIKAYSEIENQVLGVLIDRLKVQQRDAGVRHDLIDAVFALGDEDDLVRLLARVKALQAFVGTDDGADLLTGYKRAANILKKEKWDGRREPKKHGYESLPEEAELDDALDAAEPRAAQAIAEEDFERAMKVLASLRRPVDAFFDKVTVNDSNPEKRERRLNLLARLRDAVDRVADFSKIEG